MRQYLVSGGAMGWHPDLVRSTSISDFNASFEGYLLGKGVTDDSLDDEEVDEMQAELAAFTRANPRGRGSLRLVKGAING